MPKNANTLNLPAPTPVVAAYPPAETTWQEELLARFLTPVGIAVGSAAVLILLIIFGVSLGAFISGDPISGTASLFAIVLLAGGMVLITRHILGTMHADTTDAEAYAAWQAWLAKNYRLDLTDDQNNQLVNGERGRATMNPDGTWGSTYISKLGRVMTVRLVGNETEGYRLEQLKGRRFLPMRER